jgi:adenosylcobinamide-GDP ribazoletransferase
MFYTRIPATIDHNPDYLNKASRYFPLVGWIVGSAVCSFYVFNFLVGPDIAYYSL